MSIRPAKSNKFDFVDVCNLESIFRHKGTALGVFILGALLTWGFLSLRQRNYDSNAKAFVRVGRESVTVDPTAAATGQMLQLSDSQKRAIQSSIDILQSDEMVHKLIEYFGTQRILGVKESDRESNYTAGTSVKRLLQKFKGQLAALNILEPKNEMTIAAGSLRKRINVRSEADSNVLSIRVRSEDPEFSQELNAKLLEIFREAHLKAHRSPGAFAFFTEQLELTRKEIAECSSKLSAVKNSSNVTSVSDKRSVLSEKLKAIELAMLTAKGDFESSVAKTTELGNAIESLPEKLVTSEIVGLTNTSKDDMRSKLYTLELELADLAARYTPEHPLVLNKRSQVEDAKRVHETETTESQKTTTTNPSREQFVVQRALAIADTASAKAKIQELESQQHKLESEVQSLNKSEAEIESLERDLAVLGAKHQRYSEALEQSRVDDALQAERLSSVNIIQAPTLELSPVDVSNTIIFMGGVFVSIVAAIGSTFILRYVKDELLTPQDVERELRVPVLATIPRGKDGSLQ